MIISYPRVVMVGGTELIFVSGPPFSSFRITPPTCYVSPNQSIHTSTNPQCSDQAPFLGSPRRKYQFCTHNPPPLTAVLLAQWGAHHPFAYWGLLPAPHAHGSCSGLILSCSPVCPQARHIVWPIRSQQPMRIYWPMALSEFVAELERKCIRNRQLTILRIKECRPRSAN